MTDSEEIKAPRPGKGAGDAEKERNEKRFWASPNCEARRHHERAAVPDLSWPVTKSFGIGQAVLRYHQTGSFLPREFKLERCGQGQLMPRENN